MGIITNGKIHILGNFAEYTDKKPDSFEEDYKMMVRYDEALKGIERPTLGKVVCDCVMVKEHYMPYYGWDWYHSDECAIMKHYNKYPQMANFGVDPSCIASTG
jgi:hypothetical protein